MEGEKLETTKVKLFAECEKLQLEVQEQWSKTFSKDVLNCSVVRQALMSGPDCIKFDALIGMDKAKDELKNAFIKPLKYPNLYPAAAKGILLYGPPGTGKTYLIKAAINELQGDGVNILFYAPSAAELKGKYVGETEQKIAAYFDCAAKNALHCHTEQSGLAPSAKTRVISVIFIDEIDSLAPSRSSDETGITSNAVNMLLQKMDGIVSTPNVSVIAATNYPWKIDSAVRRRLDREIFVNVPSRVDIERIMELELRGYLRMHKSPTDTDRVQDVSKLLTSGVTCNPTCTPPEFTQGITDSIKFLQLASLDKVTLAMSTNKYSSSDVKRVVNRAIQIAARRAHEFGVFRQYSLNGKAVFLPYNEETQKIIKMDGSRIVKDERLHVMVNGTRTPMFEPFISPLRIYPHAIVLGSAVPELSLSEAIPADTQYFLHRVLLRASASYDLF